MLEPRQSLNSDPPPSRRSMAVEPAADEAGGRAVKYALIAAGIGAAVAVTVYTVGTTTSALYQLIADLL
jgi:Flp pilus assembly pilin Flp